MTLQNLESEIEECLYDAKACEQITREIDKTIQPKQIGEYTCEAFHSTERQNIGFTLTPSAFRDQIKSFEFVKRRPGMIFAEEELSNYVAASDYLIAVHKKIEESERRMFWMLPSDGIYQIMQSISDFQIRYSDIMKFTAEISIKDIKESIERSRAYVNNCALNLSNPKRELAIARLPLIDKCLESRAELFSNEEIAEKNIIKSEKIMALDLYRGRVQLTHAYFSKFMEKYSQNSESANANGAGENGESADPFEMTGIVLSYIRTLVGIGNRAIESNFR